MRRGGDGARGGLPWPVVAVVGTVAFVVPLVPVLRGGGLSSLVSYDGAVYYAASAGLSHGRLPYQDFLLLHPPGITVLLLPFALLGRLAGDPIGMAAARLAFLVLAAVNAVLVARLLRPVGLVAALSGGLFSAVFLPAAFAHRTVTLEGAGASLLLAAMLLAAGWRTGRPVTTWSPLAVGVLLGVAASTKIWGVAMVAPLVAWAAVQLGLRAALLVVAGAGAAVVAICAPFAAAAPAEMWRMVVTYQLARDPQSADLWDRAIDIVGLALLPGRGDPLVVALGLLLALAACGLALLTHEGRLGVLVLTSAVVILLAAPTWFLQYSSLSAAPAAVVAGAALGALVERLPLGWLRTAVTGVALLGLSSYAAALTTATWGTPFPGRSLAAALADTRGCVTTDQPLALIETDLLRRNLERGCPLVVDLGGYSYALPAQNAHGYVVRDRHQPWQRFALEYLASGDATVQLRHGVGRGFTRQTAATVESWPVIARVGPYTVRRPLPLPAR